MALFSIRPARGKDLPRLIELQGQSPQAAQWTQAQYESAIAGEFFLECLVAESQGRVEGMIVYRRPVGGEAEIFNLAVSPEYRRQGIGRSLVSEVCEQRAAVFFLEVRRGNRGGIEFYRQCGFQETGYRKDYYRNPCEDAIVMRRGDDGSPPGP